MERNTGLSARSKSATGLPEFAAVLPPPGAPPPLAAGLAGGGREAALSTVKGPATGLIVTAILNLLLALWGVVKMTVLHANLENLPSTPPFDDPGFQRL